MTFKTPDFNDFVVMVNSIERDSHREMKLAVAGKISLAASLGQLGNGRFPFQALEGFRPHYLQFINNLCGLAAGFHTKYGIPLDKIIEVLEQKIEEAISVFSGFQPLQDKPATLTCMEELKQKKDDALYQLRIGYIGYKDLGMQTSVRRTAFQLLKAIYEENLPNFMDEISFNEAGKGLALSHEDYESARSYLLKNDLIERTTLGGFDVGTITSLGIAEVEDMIENPERETHYFPAQTINIQTAINSPIQQGTIRSVQNNEISVENLFNDMREAVKQSGYERSDLVIDKIDDLEGFHRTGEVDIKEKYTEFLSFLSDHVTVMGALAPYIAPLAQMLLPG